MWVVGTNRHLGMNLCSSSSREHIATREVPGSEHDSRSRLKLLAKHYSTVSEFITLFKGATLELAVSWETHRSCLYQNVECNYKIPRGSAASDQIQLA